jgi:hypothetical protein
MVLMNNHDKEKALKCLIDKYLELRSYPFKAPWSAFYNWLQRLSGDKEAFSVIRNHDLITSFNAHEIISSLIAENKLQTNELKDFVVYLKIHNGRLSYKGIFIIGVASLFTGVSGLYKIGSGEFPVILLVVFGVFSIGMILERIYLYKYKTLYEELTHL